MTTETTAERIARLRQERAGKTTPVVAASVVRSDLSQAPQGEASTAQAVRSEPTTASSQPTVDSPANPTNPAQELTPAQKLIAEMRAKREAAKPQAQPVTQATVAAKLAELPTGSAEVEAAHPDLCEATRSLCSALEEANDGMLYWLDRCHEQLRGNPELIHMLSDEQTRVLYRAAIARSGIKIVPEKAPKAKAAKGTGKVQATIDDM